MLRGGPQWLLVEERGADHDTGWLAVSTLFTKHAEATALPNPLITAAATARICVHLVRLCGNRASTGFMAQHLWR